MAETGGSEESPWEKGQAAFEGYASVVPHQEFLLPNVPSYCMFNNIRVDYLPVKGIANTSTRARKQLHEA